MRCCRFIFLMLIVSTLMACERYKPSYKVPKASNQGGQTGQGPTPAGPVPGPGPQPEPGSNTDILLVSTKFDGADGRYSGLAKFAGVTSPKATLTKVEGGMKLSATGLPSSKTDILTVEIYEGDKLRFIAKKAKLELAAVSPLPNTVKLDDCLILAAPWDGTKSDASCNWVIEEVK